jgi:Flavodoxin domain
MKVVVIYESMYGNTHAVADAIAAGLREGVEAIVVPVQKAEPGIVADADVIVVGGPTHVHGISRAATRNAAMEAAHKDGELALEPDADGSGLREWFASVGQHPASAAAFDTRIDAPAALTGRASKVIAKQLRRHGCTLLADPESFLVTKHNVLVDGEEARAKEWGAKLADNLQSQAGTRSSV